MLRITRIISSSLIAALAACGGTSGPYSSGGGGDGNPPPPPPPANTVNATVSETFTPATLNINAGEAMTFVFAALAHNVTFDTQSTGTPANIPGNNTNKSVQRTFAIAGTYAYHCTIHPGMHGSVVVR
jgi:plastocyanin